MKYCVLFPNSQNVHLIKDVGMIAYKLFKLYKVDAVLATYKNDEYSYLNKEVKGLKIEYIKKRFKNEILDCFLFLIKNSKQIDVLQIFHVTFSSVIYALTYKLFNKQGKVFLKLDCTEALVDKIEKLGNLNKILFNYFFRKVDIIGVEQKKILEKLRVILAAHSHKLEYVPNGIDYEAMGNSENTICENKEDIILNVGRIGSSEKATDVLLRAFVSINGITKSNWKLVFVGPIEEKFSTYIKEFIQQFPQFKERIEFKGAIYNREELNNEYRRAKIYCLSSNYESFGISLIEAASYGNVIVSTDVGIASELVNNNWGAIVNIQDVEALSDALEKFINYENLNSISRKMMSICYENFNWDVIVKRLYKRIGL